MTNRNGRAAGSEQMTAGREAWIDVAKGIAIVLVVFFHAVTLLGDVGFASFW